MNTTFINSGNSRSFPSSHPLLEQSTPDGDVVIIIGQDVDGALASLANPGRKVAVLLELGTECLGTYTGESRGKEGSNILGFSRFRLGTGDPSNLIELVRQPETAESAIAAARQVLEAAGFKVAVCFDFQGRIVDRLVRPYYNAALRRLDESLATADDLDLTLRLGLGYPEGPIALLERTGLEHHFDVSRDLFDAFGDAAYAPARRARVAKARAIEEEEG